MVTAHPSTRFNHRLSPAYPHSITAQVSGRVDSGIGIANIIIILRLCGVKADLSSRLDFSQYTTPNLLSWKLWLTELVSFTFWSSKESVVRSRWKRIAISLSRKRSEESWIRTKVPWHHRSLHRPLLRARLSNQVRRQRQLRQNFLLMAPALTVTPEPVHLRRP